MNKYKFKNINISYLLFLQISLGTSVDVNDVGLHMHVIDPHYVLR